LSPAWSATVDPLLAGHAYGYAVGVTAPAELEVDVVVGTSTTTAEEVSELSVVDSPKSAEYVGGMSVLMEDDIVELEDDVVDWLPNSVVDELAKMVDVDNRLVDPGIEVGGVYAPGWEEEPVELESDTAVVESPATDEDEDDWVLPESEDMVELEVVPMLDDNVTELPVKLLLEVGDWVLPPSEDDVELDVVVTIPGGVIEDEDWEIDDRDDEDTEVELEVEGELIVLDDEDDEDTELELEVEGELSVVDDSDDEDNELELEVVVIISGGSDIDEELVVVDPVRLIVLVRLVELIVSVELELEDLVESLGGPAE
jgi:hypothetical protein